MKEFFYQGDSTKLTKYLLSELSDVSYFTLQKLLRNGDIKLNGKKINKDIHINSGDNIKVYCIDKESFFDPKTIYEDENIIVFFKPIKIASQGENSFESRVKMHINNDYVLCHRLDTNTQGLLLFAKSNEIFEEIKTAFKNKQIEKHYFAIVYGKIDKEQTFVDYLLKNEKESSVKVFSQKLPYTQQIITKVTPLLSGEISHFDVELITGKTHQIRAHLAFLGFPIIGDGKYGNQAVNRKYKAKTQKLVAYKIIFKTETGLLKYLFNKEISVDYTFLTQN